MPFLLSVIVYLAFCDSRLVSDRGSGIHTYNQVQSLLASAFSTKEESKTTSKMESLRRVLGWKPKFCTIESNIGQDTT